MSELGLFARHWSPGAVKTRLAATIGGEAAARVYRASLAITLRRFRDVAQRRAVVFTPVNRVGQFERLAAPHWHVLPQVGDDLGARMSFYFAHALRRGAQRVVLIGSDSPTLPIDYVQQAFAALERVPVVLGPATDGGYYLVGMSRFVPALFEGIEWSTASVWQQSVDKLKSQAVPFHALPPWHDFDDLADLQRLRLEVEQLVAQEAEYLPLLAAMEDALTGKES